MTDETRTDQRRPLKHQSLNRLRAIGIPVGGVIDIGALTGTQVLINSFPDIPHLLVEPIKEWTPHIAAAYKAAGIPYELVTAAAAEADGEMHMEVLTVSDKQAITHARLTDRTSGPNIRAIPVRALDSLLAERPLPAPYLLKIDVDGAEMRVLAGAQKVLADCSVVVIEAGLRSYLERAGYLHAHGFELFDIVDPCYYDGRLRQFDLVFVKTAILRAHGLDMFTQMPFDIGKWKEYK